MKCLVRPAPRVAAVVTTGLVGWWIWAGIVGPPGLAAGADPSIVPPQPTQPQMVRDQLFFAGRETPGGPPTIVALVVQRQRQRQGQGLGLPNEGAVVEAKAFIDGRGEWRTPFWGQVTLDAWPGDDLYAAVDAWTQAGDRSQPRLTVSYDDHALAVKVRTQSRRLEIDAGALVDAGSGWDPHGTVTWRAGAATAWLDGHALEGVCVWERLVDGQSAPHFGQFEMWLMAPAAGGLVLARAQRPVAKARSALRISPTGAASRTPFAAAVLSGQLDPESGFSLPQSWQVGAERLTRRGGQIGRGQSPSGGPAAYDISVASVSETGTHALVFHLRDSK